jgi:hypothetical protein
MAAVQTSVEDWSITPSTTGSHEKPDGLCEVKKL